MAEDVFAKLGAGSAIDRISGCRMCDPAQELNERVWLVRRPRLWSRGGDGGPTPERYILGAFVFHIVQASVCLGWCPLPQVCDG